MFDQPPAYYVDLPDQSQIDKTTELEICLKNCFQIDQKSTALILNKLTPFLENSKNYPVIDEFINRSKALHIRCPAEKPEPKLPVNDPTLLAPEWHQVLFENSCIRVLWLESKPNDREPFHTHHWKSLMLIVQPAKFEIQNRDGSIETDDWPIGVYELPAETKSSAYTNLGPTEFKALRFEIKA